MEGQVDIKAQLKKRDVVKVVRDGFGNVTNLADMNENIIDITDTVDTWSDLQSIPKTSANHNLIIFVAQVGVGGSFWRYDHQTLTWVLPNPILYSGNVYGSVASPTVKIDAGVTAATMFTLPSGISIPAGMLRAGSKCSAYAFCGRAGAVTATTVSLYLGTSGDSTDASMAIINLTATDGFFGDMNPVMHFSATNSLTSTYSLTHGGGGGAISPDKTLHIDTTAAMSLSVGAAAKDTTTVLKLLALDFWIHKI